MPFPFALARLGAKPLEPFGKGSNALKAGTPDAGPEGPTVPFVGAYTPARPSGQPPAGVSGRGALYAAGTERQGESGPARVPLRLLDQLGKPHCKLDAFADLLC